MNEQLPQPPREEDGGGGGDAAIELAVHFLKDPRVGKSPTEQKIRFLKRKGLRPNDIKLAFQAIGETVTIEQINAAIPYRSANSGDAAGVPSRSFMSPPAPQTIFQPAPRPTASHTLYPSMPSIHAPPSPPLCNLDWRDAVIGIGAAAVAVVGSLKLFQLYSPYEIRRKDEGRHHRTTRRARERQMTTPSSGSEMDCRPARRVPTLPVPSPPQKSKEEEATVSKLQQELAETKEALLNERKRGADLAVSAAKLRGEKQQIARTNEKLSQQLDELKERMKAMEEERQPPSLVNHESPSGVEGVPVCTPNDPPIIDLPASVPKDELTKSVPVATGSEHLVAAPQSDMAALLETPQHVVVPHLPADTAEIPERINTAAV